jgi:predicted RNA-binding protein with PUA-like domain
VRTETSTVKHWLLKTEPDTYAWSDLARKRRDRWDGIRNPQARNNLAAMSVGDTALIYHTGEEKRVVGVAKVAKAAYPDPGADDSRWLAVDVEAVRPLERPVTLAEIKAESKLAGLALLKQSRLSVVPLAKVEFDAIVRMSEH